MTVAQGIAKQLKIVKQSALGTPGSTGSQLLRRETSIFSLDTNTYENDEIVSHQQSVGIGYGGKSTKGTITGLLSPATYKLMFASLLRKDFVAISASTGLSLTITTSGSNWNILRGSGSYLSDGYKVGDVIRLSVGALNAANIAKNLLILAIVDATHIIVYPLNAVALVAEGPITTCTITATGKKSWVPTTGHTNDYFTIEEWYADLVKSELYTDTKCSQIDVDIPSNGNVKMTAQFIGLSKTRGTAEVCTSPTAETTTSVLTGAQGDIYLSTGTNVTTTAAAAVTAATSLKLSISGDMSIGDATISNNGQPVDVNRGRVKVSGTLTGLFDSTTIQAMYDGQTPVSIIAAISADQTATSDFITFVASRIKFTGDAPDDGEKNIMRTYPFNAEIDGNGGSALAYNQTIISMQDSAA